MVCEVSLIEDKLKKKLCIFSHFIYIINIYNQECIPTVYLPSSLISLICLIITSACLDVVVVSRISRFSILVGLYYIIGVYYVNKRPTPFLNIVLFLVLFSLWRRAQEVFFSETSRRQIMLFYFYLFRL